MHQGIFSTEAVNTGRQPEFDLAKAVMLFCLALIHCTIECTPEPALAHGIPYLFDTVIGGPFSAPTYMFAMGMGMAYTHRRTPADFLRRGFQLLIISYAFNVCRILLPSMVGYWITGDTVQYIEPLPYRFFGNDILQFAGLSMLLLALLLRLRIPDGALLLLSLLCSLAGTALVGVNVGNPWGNIFLGYLIGTEDAAGMVLSDFPLLNWLLFPVCGYLFGKRLRHVSDKNRFYAAVSGVGFAVTVIYFPIGLANGFGMFGEGQNCYYHLSTPDALACLALSIGMLGVYHVLARHLPGWVMAIAGDMSRNINVIYCVHWVLVCVIVRDVLFIARGTQVLSVAATLALGTVISVVSAAFAHFWTEYGKNCLLRGHT